MMARILFRVDANATIGYGHFYRCLSLAEMLSSEHSIAFASIDLPLDLQREIKERAWSFHKVDSVYEFPHPDLLVSRPVPFDLTSIIVDFDLVVLDGYHFSNDYFKAVRKEGKKQIFIDDLGIQSPDIDCIINHAPGASYADYQPRLKHVIYALGLDFALIRDAFRTAAHVQRKPNQLLLILGGTHQLHLKKRILNWLLASTDYDIHCVGGEMITEKLTESGGRLIQYEQLDAAKLGALMRGCALGILPASTLSIEAVACELPIVIGTLADNQRKIYGSLVSDHEVVGVGEFTAISKESLLEAVRQIENKETKPRAIVQHVDLRVKSIVRLLLQASKVENRLRMRNVTASDQEIVYQINNSPSVRSQSFNEKKIEKTSHIAWFKQKLADPKSLFYAFENDHGEVVGITRFDIKESHVLSSIALDTKFTGKGLGTEMLIRSVDAVRALTELKIIAQIKADNVASRRAFEKASFIFDSKSSVNNTECDQYRYAY